MGDSGIISDLNSHTYYNENAFNTLGQLIDPSQTSVANFGAIVPLANPDRHVTAKAWVNKVNTFGATQTFEEGSTTDNAAGVVDLPSDGNSFIMQLQNGQITALSVKPVGTRIQLIATAIGPLFEDVTVGTRYYSIFWVQGSGGTRQYTIWRRLTLNSIRIQC